MPQFKTLEEAQKAFDALETEHMDLKETADLAETEKNKAVKESMSRKNLIKELTEKNEAILNTLSEAGLEFEDGEEFTPETIKGSIEKAKAGATKDTTPNSEVQKVLKKMEAMEARAAKAEADTLAEKKANRVEKARNAFTAAAAEHFDDLDTVIENASLKGLFDLNEQGVPVIKDGEELVPIKVEKGTTGIDILKKLYPKQVKTAQKGGSGSSSSGQRPGNGIKEVSLEEFNQLDHVAKAALVEEAKAGKAKIG
jgi:ribosome maturation protein Sdo1